MFTRISSLTHGWTTHIPPKILSSEFFTKMQKFSCFTDRLDLELTLLFPPLIVSIIHCLFTLLTLKCSCGPHKQTDKFLLLNILFNKPFDLTFFKLLWINNIVNWSNYLEILSKLLSFRCHCSSTWFILIIYSIHAFLTNKLICKSVFRLFSGTYILEL